MEPLHLGANEIVVSVGAPLFAPLVGVRLDLGGMFCGCVLLVELVVSIFFWL